MTLCIVFLKGWKELTGIDLSPLIKGDVNPILEEFQEAAKKRLDSGLGMHYRM